MEKNREIKYKSLYRGQWYNVKELALCNGLIYPNQFEGENFSPDLEHVKCTVQFTGLLDKNGKEVYEGDILMYIASSMSDMSVEFKDGCFVGVGPFNTHPLINYINAIDFESIEVIGNIYEPHQ